jgi:hypothetical protein
MFLHTLTYRSRPKKQTAMTAAIPSSSSSLSHVPLDTAWAQTICWDLKHQHASSDASYRQDAALLRQYVLQARESVDDDCHKDDGIWNHRSISI